jgi:uncharacterized membrane protein YgcG
MRRLVGDLRELRRVLRELFEPFDEQAARRALAASARLFSRRTRRTLDDKLTFTATLVRAGEVEAANQMFAEVERDVRTEEAALMETVNEVRSIRAAKRAHTTRLRLARTLAVALLGSVVMTGSALGMTLARMFEDRGSSSGTTVGAFQLGGSAPSSVTEKIYPRALKAGVETVRIGDLKVKLDASQARAYKLIANGSVEGDALDALLALLPQEVQDVLTTATDTVAQAEPTKTVEVVDQVVRDVAKKKKEGTKQEQPEPEPSPEPSPSDDGSGDGGSGGGGSGGGDGGEQNALDLGDS